MYVRIRQDTTRYGRIRQNIREIEDNRVDVTLVGDTSRYVSLSSPCLSLTCFPDVHDRRLR